MKSTALAKTSRTGRGRLIDRAPGAAARLVRPASPRSAVAAAGGRAGRSLSRSGCRKSCCSRPGSKRSGRISRNSWRAGPMSQRSAAPRSTTCCGCGPGSAITRGRATCTPARSRCCAIMAACFPIPRKACARLPGIGPYTAAAIAAIAFDRRTMPVDGNIERVVSRLFAVEEPLPQAKPLIQQLAATLLGRLARRRREVSRRR